MMFSEHTKQQITTAIRRVISLEGFLTLVLIVLLIHLVFGLAEQSTSYPTSISQTGWTTTHTYSGYGGVGTEAFHIQKDWRIIWSCDLSQSIGQYSLTTDVVNSDGTYSDPGAVNTTCIGGNTSGVVEEHNGENVSLVVRTSNFWKIDIKEKLGQRSSGNPLKSWIKAIIHK